MFTLWLAGPQECRHAGITLSDWLLSRNPTERKSAAGTVVHGNTVMWIATLYITTKQQPNNNHDNNELLSCHTYYIIL